MKKIIYLSILLVTLTAGSCRNQDDMVQLTDVKPSNSSATRSSDNVTNYATFNSSAVQLGDPTLPPRD